MPNTMISIYLTDEEYVKYVPKKKEINGKVRLLIRENIKE
jgi:hypothetical protein